MVSSAAVDFVTRKEWDENALGKSIRRSEAMPITVLTIPVIEWARAHPTMFFDDGKVTAQSIIEQLMDGARTLGATTAETLSIGTWHIVAAEEDWFLNARLPIPENLRFDRLVDFPEQGQNCVRPEFLAAAFARDVIVKAENSGAIILGTVLPADEIYAVLANRKAWRRVIGFRGVGPQSNTEQ
ncbi:hypothetical protein QFZ83_001726 [Variovorax sp. W1I1]|uniref:hypothetical protein n=1 Tax=Variovorax sp. W1I1 TaxID=3042309 RepID=UPI00278877C5|nr:hypothetical protein [Variovorax sp. W1I1]MDQ0607555.1 hypothetical protein [Variovorax sp. W1I1]